MPPVLACLENAAIIIHLQTLLEEKVSQEQTGHSSNDAPSAVGPGSSSGSSMGMAVKRAISSLRHYPHHVKSLQEAKHVKHVGPMILKLLKSFFSETEATPKKKKRKSSAPSASTQQQQQQRERQRKGQEGQNAEEEEQQQQQGEGDVATVEMRQGKEKETRPYIPRVKTAAFALLITLYREQQAGRLFLPRGELMELADDSGLSECTISPLRTSLPGPNGSSRGGSGFYSGWSCMGELINKGLVRKFSQRPTKYSLLPAGERVAVQCIERAEAVGVTIHLPPSAHGGGTNLRPAVDSTPPSSNDRQHAHVAEHGSVREHGHDARHNNQAAVLELSSSSSSGSEGQENEWGEESRRQEGGDGGEEDLQRERVVSNGREMGSSRSREQQHQQQHQQHQEEEVGASSREEQLRVPATGAAAGMPRSTREWMERRRTAAAAGPLATLPLHSPYLSSPLALPPAPPSTSFLDIYDVILVIDMRERSGRNERRPMAADLRQHFNLFVEERALPLGDVLWVARSKQTAVEYVLDFIVERKRVDDLWHSVRGKRFKDQKLRLMQCGISNVIFIVEGSIEEHEKAQSIRTATLHTEVEEGFDVEYTRDLRDTSRRYCDLTAAIVERYEAAVAERGRGGAAGEGFIRCRQYSDFEQQCREMKRCTVRDTFCHMLLQVHSVTEEAVLAITAKYPTPHSLFSSLSLLEGNTEACVNLIANIPLNGKTIGRNIGQKLVSFLCKEPT